MLTTRTRRGAILVSVLALGIGSALAAPPASAAGPYDDKVVISSGHVDVLYPTPTEDGGALLQLHDDTSSPHAYRAPEDVVFHVKPSVAQRTANAYIADVTAPEERAKGYGMIGAAFGLGWAAAVLIARGRIVSAGRRLIFAEARIEGGGRLLATASATLAIAGEAA